ncbi:MAG TPA: hypothetical protein PLV70_10155, partial [Flavobacteriales bacterium]|nr:hypothetical protein [Flavobacteriales bacterium]
ENDRMWLGADKEWLVQYCRELLHKDHFDFLIFGHRHLPVDMELVPAGSALRDPAMVTSGSPAGDPEGATKGDPAGTSSRYINLGDWITHFTYAVFDGEDMKLMKREGDGSLSADRRISGGPAE